MKKEQNYVEVIERMMFAMPTYKVDGIRIYPALSAAKKALEKQIPKKPIIEYGEETSTHNLGRLMSFHCPSCRKFIVAIYETDVERGGGIHREMKGCATCLQAIDFTEHYHIDKLNEEIDWSE